MLQLPPPQSLSDLATKLFGERLNLAQSYAEILRTDGAKQGLIGPREIDRVWERHIINCALMAQAIDTTPPAAGDTETTALKVADIGSGAGLPGLVLAIARPQVKYTLIETMQRRVNFLNSTVEKLGLENVEVVRARAEELHGEYYFDIVTARAVAALDKLATWSLPLVKAGGQMVAMKGQSAAEEIIKATPVLKKMGIKPLAESVGKENVAENFAKIELITDPAVEVPTTLVRIKVDTPVKTKTAVKGGMKPAPKTSMVKKSVSKTKRKNHAHQKGKTNG